MQIAIVTPEFHKEIEEIHGRDRVIFGGSERYAFELDRMLKDLGHDVTWYQPYRPVKGRTDYPQEIRKTWRGMKFVCIFNNEQGSFWGGLPQMNMHFNQYAVGADLRIYFLTTMCYPQVLHPAISISHGVFWDHVSSAYKLNSWEHRARFLEANIFGFSQPDICVCVDHNTRNVVQTLEPGMETRIEVIPNFVDTKVFHPGEKNWNGTRILFPRRTTLIRGWNLFSNAARKLPQFNFITCGEAGLAGLQEDLEEVVANSKSNLVAVHRDMDDMPEMYRSVDIGVVPTIACEGSSLSAAEIMATGLPLITTNIGGIQEYVIDGYNAIVFNPNRDKLEDAIVELTNNPLQMKEMGMRNREIAERCFDIGIWRSRWKKVLEKVR